MVFEAAPANKPRVKHFRQRRDLARLKARGIHKLHRPREGHRHFFTDKTKQSLRHRYNCPV